MRVLDPAAADGNEFAFALSFPVRLCVGLITGGLLSKSACDLECVRLVWLLWLVASHTVDAEYHALHCKYPAGC